MRRLGARARRSRPARRGPLARAWWATLVLLVLGTAAAEGWTIQTVAVRDLREARAIASDLVRAGYDAYTEFAMDDDGRQWVRVRVGCYATRNGAEALAVTLRGRVTAQAVVVRRTTTAPARGCVRRSVGFRTADADAWSQPEPGVATFVVEVAGVTGVLRYLEDGWRVLQEPATAALPPGPAATDRFAQATRTARPFVRVEEPEGAFLVCPGRLLAQVGDAAVVDDGGVVTACAWRPPVAKDAEAR